MRKRSKIDYHAYGVPVTEKSLKENCPEEWENFVVFCRNFVDGGWKEFIRCHYNSDADISSFDYLYFEHKQDRGDHKLMDYWYNMIMDALYKLQVAYKEKTGSDINYIYDRDPKSIFDSDSYFFISNSPSEHIHIGYEIGFLD